MDTLIFINKRVPELKFRVKLSNTTKQNFLIYGFTILEESTSNLDFYRKPEITAGMVAYLKSLENLNGKNVYLGLVQEQLCGRAITIDSVEAQIIKVGNILRASRIFLRRETEVLIEYNVILETKRIPKVGDYQFRLLYFSGKNIVNLVPVEDLASDARKFDAIVFQGFAESNKVDLRVR